jgi:hypothetical protein
MIAISKKRMLMNNHRSIRVKYSMTKVLHKMNATKFKINNSRKRM